MDSLLLNTYELIGTVTDSWVELEPAFTLGEPVPDVSTIVGLLLDGDQVTGSRSGNRTVTLPLTVTGTTRLDMAANVNKLISIVNDPDPFTLTWTPNGGLSVVLDCYRGSFERVRVDVIEQQFVTTLNLTFPAAPFGRSNVPQTVSVAVAQLQIDAMDAVTPPVNTTRDTGTKYEGTASASFTFTRTSFLGGYYYVSPTISRTITSTDLSAKSGVTFRMQWASPATGAGGALAWKFSNGIHLTLSDGTRTATVSVTDIFPSGDTSWHLESFSVAAFAAANASLNLAAITSWSLSMAADLKYMGAAPASTSTARLDDLRALPSSSVSNSTAEGSVLTIPAVLGTAPTPVALTVTRPASAVMTGLLIHRPPVWQSPDAAILAALSGSPKTVTIAAANNTYEGTYAVCLVATTLGTGTRTVTVTLAHKQGATTLATQAIATTYSTAPTGNFVIVGQTTLPLVPVPDENSSDTLVITVTSSGGTADTFADVVLLDTYGQEQTYGALPSGTTVVYVDEPDPVAEIGQAYASATDRTAAVGILGWGAFTRADGGPVVFEPGDNRLLLVAPDGTPQVAASFYPRWLDERTA